MTTLISIPFFTDTIRMNHIIEASKPELFKLEGQQIRAFIQNNPASLREVKETGELQIVVNSDFITFKE